jgi:hypothetical protein
LSNFVKNIQENQNFKYFKEIGVNYWYCWKALDEVEFLGDDFIIFRPEVGEILILSNFHH